MKAGKMLLAMAAVFLRGRAGAVEYSGTLNTNTTWTAADTVVIVGDLTVAPGITLTVQAGAVVQFRGNFRLTVNGELAVTGSALQPEVFRPENSGASPGAWYGIVAAAGSTINIDQARIEKAKYGLYSSTSNVVISNSEISHCQTNGIYLTVGSLSATALRLHHNGQASSDSAVYVGGGANVNLTNALIYANTGYGVYAYQSTANLTNCTVHGNSRYGLNYYYYASGTVKNCIITANGNYGIYNYSSTINASYNNVWGNSGDNSGGGSNSISLDPQYVNSSADNFHLLPNSPCIDIGTSSGAPDHDLDGQPRPQQGQDPGSPRHDLGAYEFSLTANRYPIADAGPDRTVIKGEPATFDGTASYDPDGSIASWHWDFGDGGTADTAVAAHTFQNAGNFVVTLTVTDNGGLTNLDRANVHVNTRPVANAGPDKVAEVGELVYFDGSASSDVDGSIVAYRWDFGDGTQADGRNVSHRYQAGGVFTATLTVTDDYGATGTDQAQVSVSNPGDNTGPVIQHTPLAGQPSGNQVMVVASISDESGVASASLFYKKTSDAQFTEAAMSQVAGNQWSGTIPAAAVTTVGVDYYLKAVDASPAHNQSLLPAGAPASFYHFDTISVDNQPPTIEHTPVANGQPEGQAVAVSARVTDASGVDRVMLYYRGPQDAVFTALEMAAVGDDYSASIPAAAVRFPQVEYFIEASDAASPANTGTLPADAPAQVFSFTVERNIVANPGDVIITEIMADTSLSEPSSEWFELYNTTGQDIDLTG